MRAFAVDEFGGRGSTRELPAPAAGEGEVLVRVRAAGVNQTDVAVIAGFMKDYVEHRFPLIPGIDASGVVEQVGAGVDGFREGDEVYGFVRRPVMGVGTFAEQVALPVGGIQGKPTGLRHEEAAIIGHSGLTAIASIQGANLGPGKRIVIIGATGGVGSFATQLAARTGAHVTAVSRGDHLDYARSLGADEAIDYDQAPDEVIRASAPDGVDLLADVGGAPQLMMQLLPLVKSGGRVVSILFPPDPEALAARGIEGRLATRWEAEHEFDNLCDWIATGTVQLPAIQTFPFDQVGDALELQATRHVAGKLALVM
jgi:NADPH:quinone reductase-like Zn-dependent oxidoreductase